MKIIINTAHQRFGGAIQVALSFINECKAFPEHQYHVFVGPGVGKSIEKSSFPENFHFYDFDFGILGLKSARTIQKTLEPLEREIQPDIFISTSGPTYYHSKAPQIIGFNLPLYIYPESPFVQEMSMKQKIKFWFRKKAHYHYFKRDAIAYVVQTDDVRERVKRALGTKNVYTVTNNHSSFYLDENLSFTPKLPERVPSEFRFLTLTSYYGHKNLELIPAILKVLKNRGITHVKFVLTLKDEDQQRHGLVHENIINIGPIKPIECPSLYRECDAMFLPTLAECFSASYPEAMVSKRPIVTTDLGFAKSICGGAALYYEPKNAASAALQIEQLITSHKLQTELVNVGLEELKKFDSPQERARKYLDLCKKYTSNKS